MPCQGRKRFNPLTLSTTIENTPTQIHEAVTMALRTNLSIFVVLLGFAAALPCAGHAAPPDLSKLSSDALAPHKALYEIDLIATHSGSQVLNISGKMSYEWAPSCEAWVTDHHFKLFYEYADTPGLRVTSDFSTYETFDGDALDYSSRRRRDGSLFQEIRGRAQTGNKGGLARYSMPEDMKYDLPQGTVFPVAHTLELIRHAKAGDKFYNAVIFDGSDEDGPVEINSFIGKEAKAPADTQKNVKIDASLLKPRAWQVRMAFFPLKSDESVSDYEMSMIFHENGIISDMTIEYSDFSVRQKLVSLEKISAHSCGGSAAATKKPE